MVYIGDRVSVFPVTVERHNKAGKTIPTPGTIVYIHPARRYCTVALEIGAPGIRINESFQLVEGEIFE